MNTILARTWSILGLVGILLCVLGITGVWYAKIRIGDVATRVFETTSESLTRVNGLLVDFEHAVDGAKITVDEIQEDLKSRTVAATKENINSRLQLETRVERLYSGLEKAELLLDTSSASFQAIRQTLELGESLGFAVRTDLLDPLLGTLTDLQADIQAARKTVDSIGESLRHEAPDVAAGPGREQLLKLTARLLVTFSNFEKRLENSGNRLTEMQNRITELEQGVHFRILLVTLAATLLLVWMGAGQIALWRR